MIEVPPTSSNSGRDVFIHYASQDLAAANAMVATLDKGGPQVRTYGVDLD
jgi:hypothetical protein